VSTEVHLSDDGRYAAFESDASDLVAPGVDANGARDVYRRDITAGTTTLVSVTDAGGAAGNGASRAARVTADGRYVAFESNATDLVGGGVDHNGATGTDVYRRDAQSNTTRLISINFDRTAAAIGSAVLLLPSGDVLFHSPGSDLTAPGQDSGGSDIFLTRNAAPAGVSFTATPDNGRAPLDVAFEASGTDVEGPVTYTWDFGDGGTAGGQSATHTYRARAGGTFTVTLTVTDRDGATASATRTITVGPDPPPVVTAFSAVPNRFAVGRGATLVSARAPKGTTFRFRLSEPARLRLRIDRALLGRRTSGRCVKPTRALRRKRKCTRYRRAGTLTRSHGVAGANRIGFSGRIGRRALKPGRYRATIVATDSAGQLSQARRITFVVVKR
jgi:PKD repeat protein